jgi:amino-acid N-acetyltransferase
MNTTDPGTPMTLVIRSAAPDDLASIERLLSAADLPVGGIGEALESFFVAEEGGRVVGVAGLERYGEFALLRSVAVARDLRARGLGSVLVERVLGLAADRCVDSVYLLTTTAGGYFPRFGFEVIGRADVPPPVLASVEFRELCPSTAVVMRRVTASPAGADA